VNAGEIVFAVGTGLAVNECCDVAPWCARRLARWSAFRRYASSTRASARAEELAAVIDDRPGNLLKLLTAFGFGAAAAAVWGRRAFARHAGSSRKSTDASAARLAAGKVTTLEHLYDLLDGNLGDPAAVREYLDKSGACLREFGLEEASRRLLCYRHQPGGSFPAEELRGKLQSRIKTILRELA
jgi:hypothetical protein